MKSKELTGGKTKRPWLTRTEKEYQEGGAWLQYGDYESWIVGKFRKEYKDEYDSLSTHVKTELYGIFCNIFDEIPT